MTFETANKASRQVLVVTKEIRERPGGTNFEPRCAQPMRLLVHHLKRGGDDGEVSAVVNLHSQEKPVIVAGAGTKVSASLVVTEAHRKTGTCVKQK